MCAGSAREGLLLSLRRRSQPVAGFCADSSVRAQPCARARPRLRRPMTEKTKPKSAGKKPKKAAAQQSVLGNLPATRPSRLARRHARPREGGGHGDDRRGPAARRPGRHQAARDRAGKAGRGHGDEVRAAAPRREAEGRACREGRGRPPRASPPPSRSRSSPPPPSRPRPQDVRLDRGRRRRRRGGAEPPTADPRRLPEPGTARAARERPAALQRRPAPRHRARHDRHPGGRRARPDRHHGRQPAAQAHAGPTPPPP